MDHLGITLQGEKIADEPSEAEVLDMAQAYADAAGDARRLGLRLHSSCTARTAI